MKNKERFTNLQDWLIALAIACGLVLIPYLVHAEERYFAVTAYNDFGESGYSAEVNHDLNKGESITLQWNEVERDQSARKGGDLRVLGPGRVAERGEADIHRRKSGDDREDGGRRHQGDRSHHLCPPKIPAPVRRCGRGAAAHPTGP